MDPVDLVFKNWTFEHKSGHGGGKITQLIAYTLALTPPDKPIVVVGPGAEQAAAELRRQGRQAEVGNAPGGILGRAATHIFFDDPFDHMRCPCP